MRRNVSGFTIVELLIVIVVIGILAAITIVAYNGIQTRAQQSANFTTIKSYTKAFQLMKADTGSLPSGYNANASCLGPTPQPDPCTLAGQTASSTSTAATKSSLAQYGLSSQPGIIGGINASVVYTSNFYGEPALLWQVPLSQDCVGSPSRLYVGGGTGWVEGRTYSNRSSTLTYCYLSLANL